VIDGRKAGIGGDMTVTPTYIDPAAQRLGPRSRWRNRAALVAVLGLALGAAVLVPAAFDDTDAPPAPPTVVHTPASADGTERWLGSLAGPVTPRASADAAERRALADQEALQERCAGSSADAVERCLTSG
jgi:hypothetical protein